MPKQAGRNTVRRSRKSHRGSRAFVKGFRLPRRTMSSSPQPTSGAIGLPLVIGITGHRDLRGEDRAALEQQVRGIFMDLRNRYPATPLYLLSPLAEGADRLVARVALNMN